MDPDANLKEILSLARELAANDQAGLYEGEDDEGGLTYYGVGPFVQKADRLAELVIALDKWVRKGGTLPKRWKR